MAEDISIKTGPDTSGFTRAVKQASQSSEQLHRSMQTMGGSAEKSARSAGDAGQAVDRFGREARSAQSATTAFGGSLLKMAAQFSLVDRGIGAVIGGVQQMGRAVGDTVLSGIKLNLEMEGIEARLQNMFGDTRKAAAALETFKQIAGTTAFTIGEVSAAGATLTAFLGTNRAAVTSLIKPVADLAAFMGTDIQEASEAFGRAMAGGAGAADILRERGILELVKSFKGIEDLTKLSLPQFRQALIEAMEAPAAGIAGATDRMSKTSGGAISNMQDAWEGFKRALTANIMPAVEQLARMMTDSLNRIIGKMGDTKDGVAGLGDALVEMFRNVQPGMEALLGGLNAMARGVANITANARIGNAAADAYKG